jgi:hypothetical protein
MSIGVRGVDPLAGVNSSLLDDSCASVDAGELCCQVPRHHDGATTIGRSKVGEEVVTLGNPLSYSRLCLYNGVHARLQCSATLHIVIDEYSNGVRV